METKQCKTCGEVKPLDQFGKDKRGDRGLRSSCRVCFAQTQRAWRAANPEKVRASQDKWRTENPEKVRTSQVKWLASNTEKLKLAQQNWYRKNAVKVKRQSADRNAGEVEYVTVGYIAKVLRVSVKDVQPEAVDAERRRILAWRIERVTRQLIQTLKEIQNVQ